MLRVADCVIGRVILRPTEWQRIGNQINAAFGSSIAFGRYSGVNPGAKAILARAWAQETSNEIATGSDLRSKISALLKRRSPKATEGSNPTPSAICEIS